MDANDNVIKRILQSCFPFYFLLFTSSKYDVSTYLFILFASSLMFYHQRLKVSLTLTTEARYTHNQIDSFDIEIQTHFTLKPEIQVRIIYKLYSTVNPSVRVCSFCCYCCGWVIKM